jgi:hypothetical protein
MDWEEVAWREDSRVGSMAGSKAEGVKEVC